MHSAQVGKGASSARSDDTKSLKGPILDWIVPEGGTLNPPIARNNKTNRGFNHDQIGALMCPVDYDWSNLEYVFFIHYMAVTDNTSRVRSKLRSSELPVNGDHWPIFLYKECSYNPDDPWDGLLRSKLLVTVSSFFAHTLKGSDNIIGVQTYIHISKLC
jgi:hypothetical protein